MAIHLSIEALKFPEHLKLEEELDPVAKELRELKSELDRTKHARPILTCGFMVEDGVSSVLSLTRFPRTVRGRFDRPA